MATKKKPGATRKGNPAWQKGVSGNPSGLPKEVPGPTAEGSSGSQPGTTSSGSGSGSPPSPVGPSALPDHAIMRKVFGQPKGFDKTARERAFRKVMEDDPAKFYDRLLTMERDAASAAPAAGPVVSSAGSSAGPLDPGSQRCVELCERLLAELRREAGLD
jgi:hypothetical protein